MYENQYKIFNLAKAKSKSSSSSLTPDNVKEKSQIGNYLHSLCFLMKFDF